MTRFRALWVGLAACAAATAALGASPDPKDLAVPPDQLSKARELLRRLGSEDYREREGAQAELAKMGRLAKLPLTQAVTSDTDPEVRLRASRLLPKAAAADLQARIDTFLADTESKFDHDLPGLKAFRKTLAAAEREKVRALYVELLKSPYNLDLLAAIDKSETEGGRAISDRRNTLWNDMQHRPFPPNGRPVPPRQPTLADTAALLFAESVVGADSIPKSNWNYINGTQFLQQAASMQALNNTGAAHADAYKVIVRHWLATRTDVNEMANLAYALNNPALLKMPETVPLLRRIITTEGVQGYSKGQALNTLMQNDKQKEIPFLKTLMTNDTMVQQVWFGRANGQNELHSCLLKDVALAYQITIAGGNIKDYGFETQNNIQIPAGQLGFGQYAFTTEEKRTVAFMRWGWKLLKDGVDAPPAKDAPKSDAKGAAKPEPKDEPKADAPAGPAPRPKPVAPVPAPAPAALPAKPMK
jgi:hypothetical protein